MELKDLKTGMVVELRNGWKIKWYQREFLHNV